jgi:hypothetical protein
MALVLKDRVKETSTTTGTGTFTLRVHLLVFNRFHLSGTAIQPTTQSPCKAALSGKLVSAHTHCQAQRWLGQQYWHQAILALLSISLRVQKKSLSRCLRINQLLAAMAY